MNVQKVMWAIGELGLAHERIDAGGAFGGLDSAAFGEMNPNRLIPVIEDQGAVLWESNAIVRYLSARYGASTLWADDPAARAQADRWMDWQISTLQADMGIVFWGLIRTPAEQRNEGAIATAAERLGGLWGRLDAHLKGRAFVAGDTLTMGDIPIGAVCYRWLNLPIQRPALPALEAWYDRLKARGSFQQHVMLPLT